MTPLTPAALAEIEQRAREAAALTTDKKMTYKQKLWAQSLATPALAADVLALLARLREVEAELVDTRNWSEMRLVELAAVRILMQQRMAAIDAEIAERKSGEDEKVRQ